MENIPIEQVMEVAMMIWNIVLTIMVKRRRKL